MAIGQQITCDICGTEKKETNHWLIAAVLSPTPDEPEMRCIAFAPIALARPDDEEKGEIKHLCGQACAHTLLSQWLETLTTPTTERQQA